MASRTAGSAEELRRRVRGWRVAEQREHALRAAEPIMEPAEALAAAFELYELRGAGSEQADVVRRREVEDARAAWRRLRARCGCPPPGTRCA